MTEAKTPFTIAIDGMHCQSCVRRVSNALSAIEGVRVDEVKVGQATGGFDAETLTTDDLVASIDAIGFKGRHVLAVGNG